MESNAIRYLDYFKRNATNDPLVCYAPYLAKRFTIWYGENPLGFTVPLFLFQIILTIGLSRSIVFLLRPLQQPRYVSEIIGGFILGPSMMGRIEYFNVLIFPLRSLMIIDTFAQYALVYFFFRLGIEGERYMVMNKDAMSLFVALGCGGLSFALGSLGGIIIHRHLHEDVRVGAFLTFLGFTLSDTSFHTLVGILGELKLLNSKLGRLALSSAMASHNFMWTVLVFNIALAQFDSTLVTLWATLTALAFFHLTIRLLKPVIRWVEIQMVKGRDIDDLCINMVLVGVLLWSILAEMVGTHHIIGALAFGLAIPNGPLSESLVERVEDFLNGLFMPFVFLIVGLRMDFDGLRSAGGVMMLIMVAVACVAIKLGVSAFLAVTYRMPPHEGLLLGLLMNTKGSIDVMALNLGASKRMLGTQSFTILVLLTIVTSAVVNPLVKTVSRPSKHLISYKRRTISWANPESELCFLTCIHAPREVPGLISLLDMTHPTKRSPIFVYALHLNELNARTSASLLNSITSKATEHHHNYSQARVKGLSDNIFNAFESYEQYADGVSVQLLTAVSPYATMHEDVISAAKDRHAAFILLSFHKHVTIDGTLSPSHPAMRTMNQNILESAPCSVGIFIDRGLNSHGSSRRVMLLFFGGPDDREGLALGSRMAGHPGIEVTVIRFIQALGAHTSGNREETTPVRMAVGMAPEENEYQKDEECLAEFKARWRGTMVGYAEIVASNAEETVAEIRRMDGEQDLYVIGRGHGKESALMMGLTEWVECPELGLIGDLMASQDFGTTASVLVVQQGGIGSPDSRFDSAMQYYLNKSDGVPMLNRQIPGQNV